MRIWSSAAGVHAVWMEVPLAWVEDEQFSADLQAAAQNFRSVIDQELLGSPAKS